MGFKEQVAADNAVFLNPEEFADKHTVRYDCETFYDIPVVLEQLKESDRTVIQSDHAEGIYKVSAKAYLAQKDIDGAFPERGCIFEIDNGEALGETFFDKYKIVTSSVEMGMIILELERYDE